MIILGLKYLAISWSSDGRALALIASGQKLIVGLREIKVSNRPVDSNGFTKNFRKSPHWHFST